MAYSGSADKTISAVIGFVILMAVVAGTYALVNTYIANFTNSGLFLASSLGLILTIIFGVWVLKGAMSHFKT